MSLWFFEQQRGTAGLQHAVTNFGYLKAGIDFGGDALEQRSLVKLCDEVAKVGVFHGVPSVGEDDSTGQGVITKMHARCRQ